MWNPFKAIGGAIAKAGQGIAKAGRAVGRTVARPFRRREKAQPPAREKAQPARETTRVMPAVQAPAKEKKLPPSMVKVPPSAGGRGIAGGMGTDDALLGADSDQVRDLLEEIREFESNHSTVGLNSAAKDFLNHPSFAAALDKYVPGGGFDPQQWESGMENVRNIRITRVGDRIGISFDADFDIDGDSGNLGTRTVNATF